jgi:uncharacterized protein with beta-barrel porin domain
VGRSPSPGPWFAIVLLLFAGTARAQQANLASLPGQNALQQRTGTAVTVVCAGLGPAGLGVDPSGASATSDLFARCRELVQTGNEIEGSGPTSFSLGLSANETNQALLEVVHDEGSAGGPGRTPAIFIHAANVERRFAALRDGATGISLAGLNLIGGDGVVPGSALLEDSASGPDGQLPEGLGIFLTGDVGYGTFDGSDEELGFDYDSWGLTGGVDYRFLPELVAGVAFSYVGSDADIDGNSGDLEDAAYLGALYAQYATGGLYVDGVVSYGGHDFDQERRIRYPGVNRTANGKTDAAEYSASVGAGYEWQIESLTIGPRVRFDYFEEDIGSYSESGAGGLNLRYGDYEVRSVTSVLGVDAAYAISTGFGVITPQIRLDWEHEYENDGNSIRARYAADPNRIQFFVDPEGPDRNYFNLGVGVVATFGSGFSAFVDYQTVLGLDDVDDHLFTVGGRYEF